MENFLQIQNLPGSLAYLVYSLNRIETVLDLLLVTITYFLILIVIRRSQAAILLRGVLILALIAIAVSALFQLPTFTFLLRATLILSLVATPLIFQPELRRGLERLGRTFGFLQIRPTELVHRVVPVLIRVASNLSERFVGGLIVIEGDMSLADIINTGVLLNADLSADLLETIFQDKTPLHDGAVIVREDHIAAAASVLPLSDQSLPDGMHQGTRHRAALGISERTDALAIVISEETGYISVAQGGKLHRNIAPTELRDYLYRFYDPRKTGTGRIPSATFIKAQLTPAVGRAPARHRLFTIGNYLATLLLSVLLAVATWLFVANQVNPPVTDRLADIPVRVVNQDRNLLVVTDVPEMVAATVQAPQDVLASLSQQSFRATVDLAGRTADVYRVPIDVKPSDDRVRVVGVDPQFIDIELRPVATRTVTATLVIPDRDTLPFSYEVTGEPAAVPGTVNVVGPADIVEDLARAEVTVPLRGARSTVRDERPVVLKDGNGKPLPGLTADPAVVQVTVPISQRFNTRDAAVHVVITGTVAPGYWISSIGVQPNTVTLLGPPRVLDEMGGFVDTVPVDVTGVAGDIVRRVPLAPPVGVSALNERGVTEGSVQVRVTVVPQMGNLRLTVPIEVSGAQPDVTVSKSPAFVDVLLSGPLPILNQIGADPKLVRVLVEVDQLDVGTREVTPKVITPDSVQATLIPSTVQLRIEQPGAAETPAPTGAAGSGTSPPPAP